MATTGSNIKSYVSAITALDTREINRKVTDVNMESRFVNVLVDGALKMPVTQWFYRTYINEALFKEIDTTGATVTGSGTATIGTAASIATSFFIRKGDEVEFVTSGKIGYVTNVVTTTSDAITIKSVDGTNITHTAGEKIKVFATAAGEASQGQSNLRYTLSSYINKVQIFQETSQITDVENASTKEVEWNGQNKWAVKDQIEKALKLKRMVEAAYIKGEMSSASMEDTSPALVDPIGGGPVQTTKGVNKYIEGNGGILDTVTTTGTVVLADFDDLQDQLLAARSPHSYTYFSGDAVKRKISTCLKNLGSSGVTSVRMVVNGRDLDFDVDQLQHGDFTYKFVNLPILDDPDLFSGTIQQKSGYLIPLDAKVKTQDGQIQNGIRIRYIKSQTKYGNDMIGEVQSGATNPINPNGETLEWKVKYITYQGLECLGTQHYARQRVLT